MNVMDHIALFLSWTVLAAIVVGAIYYLASFMVSCKQIEDIHKRIFEDKEEKK